MRRGHGIRMFIEKASALINYLIGLLNPRSASRFWLLYFVSVNAANFMNKLVFLEGGNDCNCETKKKSEVFNIQIIRNKYDRPDSGN